MGAKFNGETWLANFYLGNFINGVPLTVVYV